MLNKEQTWACYATFDNVKWAHFIVQSFAIVLKERGHKDFSDMFDATYAYGAGLCQDLASIVIETFPWANVSMHDIPQAIFDYCYDRYDD